MSTTRQSLHIFRRSAAAPAKAGWPARRPSIASTICAVPKGLAQRMQWKGLVSCSVTGWRTPSPVSRRGTSVMASSGQVRSHRPHCTQLRSRKDSTGRSLLSRSACDGQEPTQAMHKVQRPASTCTAPSGAPAGSGTVWAGTGACAAR